MQEPDIQEVLYSYQKIYPEFNFPDDFPENRKIETLRNSRGRKIFFSKQKGEYAVYFEDDDTDLIDIPKWNKLIGCGG